MLWERFPILPYKAYAPWPRVLIPNSITQQDDWIESVDIVECWLERSVGIHCVDWSWTMFTLHDNVHYRTCGVSFRYEPHVSMFLLRFGGSGSSGD